ncbi:MAG TPA: WYL domain-containing protein [archaeon]|nr:WYL domain-containing protein [archaeon]
MNHDSLEEGQVIHLSAVVAGHAVEDIEHFPISEGQSLRKEGDSCCRLRVTIPFSRKLMNRLWGYGSELRVDAPPELRSLLVRNLRMVLMAYDEAEARGAGHFAYESPQVTMRYFDDWKLVRMTCSVCEWHGSADPLGLQLNDSDRYPVSTFSCPRCGKALLAIEHSVSMEETLANINRLSPDQRVHVLDGQKWQAEFEASQLKNAEQLSDLNIDERPEKLVWDIGEDAEGKTWNIIRHGARVLWRQPASWEGYGEFSRVVAIIQKRYGNTIRDLEPTKNAEMWLCGDALEARAEIDRARRRLGWTRLP